MDADNGWWECTVCTHQFHADQVVKGTIQSKILRPPHVEVTRVVVPACPRCGATEGLEPLPLT